MSPSVTEYHLLRARMERMAAERSLGNRARAAHLLLAEIHAERAEAARAAASDDAMVPA